MSTYGLILYSPYQWGENVTNAKKYSFHEIVIGILKVLRLKSREADYEIKNFTISHGFDFLIH